MGNALEYRGYVGLVDYDAQDRLLHGKVDGIRSHILFDEREAADIETAFRNAVDEYLEDCEAEGIEPERPYKGRFNVRVAPGLHRDAAMLARSEGTSLNEVVASALALYVGQRGGVEVRQVPVVIEE